MLDDPAPYVTTPDVFKAEDWCGLWLFLIPGNFRTRYFSSLSSFNQITNMGSASGWRTRNNSSTIIESIRLETCLFIPARVRPSPAQNSPCAFHMQTKYCIVFSVKKKIKWKYVFYNIESSTATLAFIYIYFFLFRRRRRGMNMHKGNKVLLQAWNIRTMLHYKIKMKSWRTCLIFNRYIFFFNSNVIKFFLTHTVKKKKKKKSN